ncbi:hypothetical protein OIU77_021424 [Salix suchowensis]|uniref:Pentatricopeptide repeat-containing protein n=1 Tax=Salix suchowensis TaxID=1278906 RepID=A0ABQ9CDP4_9ROSI|nr:hypothetical protein OIU77_021424 [Salix suchowensis]
MSKQMQISVPIRAPSWVSTRRIFQQKLQDLHKCTNLNHIKQVHAQILKQNLHQDPYVAPKLISAFSLSQQMALAIYVFKQIPDPNVHLYNTFIRACVQNSLSLLAFETFFEMQRNGLFADNFTYPFLLKACNGQSWLPLVKMIHNHVEKYGFFQDLFVPNSLIDSYCKCGLLGVKSAMRLFMAMDERDVVSWNSMISGLLKVGELSEARKLFDEMPIKDAVSWNTILDGYVKAGEMNKAFGLFESMPERNVVSWSTMVSGYCKAGDMEMARMLFDRMPVKNLVSWTIIVSGYAVKGLAKDAMRSFEQMEEAGLKPDDGTVISILASCAESGLLGLGKRVHTSIERIRYKCKEVLDYLVKLEPSDPGNYSLLSNIFASVGDWSNVANVRLQMKNFGIQKPSGASSIEVDDEVHEFTVFDKSHPKSDKIYRMINRLDLDLKRVHVVPKVIRTVFAMHWPKHSFANEQCFYNLDFCIMMTSRKVNTILNPHPGVSLLWL